MLKISIVDTPARCRIVLEGKLIAPWVTELKKTWEALAAPPILVDVSSSLT
jgi:hypothetical protein